MAESQSTGKREDAASWKATAVAVAFFVLAGVIVVSEVLSSQKVLEPFSEIGLLGSDMKIGGYPRTVMTDEPLNLFLYLGNHEGKMMFYTVYVKLGNGTTFVNGTVPANAPVIGTYEAILADDGNCTTPVNLSLSVPMVNARLIFEMWIQDDGTTELKYHSRWLQLWVNVTRPA